MTQERKDKVKASLGTILFHALLILALFFLALKTPLPLPDEEGVEVNLGYSEVGQDVQQEQPEDRQTPPPQPVQQEVKETQNEALAEKIAEEDNDEAPAMVTKPKPKKEPEKKVEKPIEKTVIETPKEEKKPEPLIDPRLLYTGKTAAGSEGNDQQKGDKGVATGVPDAPNYSGVGGLGSEGISYNLGNRKANSLPKPIYNSNDQGRVNVRIRVDKNGRVISAEILQKGTTVSDINLHTMAIQAAQKAVFAPDPDAPEIQVGTITYNFIKIN